MIHRPISRPAVPPAFSQVSEWKQLHTFAVTIVLNSKSSIEDITEFLEKFHPPVLQDVTARFRVVDENFIYASLRKNSVDYIDQCLKFIAALSKYPRHRVSFLGSSDVHARKLLWMRELGPLFPTLRYGNRLAVDCESSERFGHSSSTN